MPETSTMCAWPWVSKCVNGELMGWAASNRIDECDGVIIAVGVRLAPAQAQLESV